mmetsp:Transcript_3933/g.8676  ORF Transcript_3933/g.8676 Transcript_3933/m.8676 type:complete len:730 (+) Transcript_3933:264-2453(+)|eukprot:CAMPEP_0183737688 /NCGR_PEP_ID=MMETSP0737-20130205/52633_1 /TAXON_ID=385413 /ORGANISM="Thalassiosira miniscula, Strain CCMP1093" /LENGTH=729 /DNA_ID=CAMNT_0025972031 /DNA_START=162 /DNA_END=2351 /DNA_ORIENTATION=+
MESNNSSKFQQCMMDLIGPDDAFDGADGLDGNDLLQALTDNEDILDFHGESGGIGGDNSGNNDKTNGSIKHAGHSESVDMAIGTKEGSDRAFARGRSNLSSNRSCSSEPFMLDSDIYQDVNSHNNNGDGSNFIGVTIKAPLPPLEPLESLQHQKRHHRGCQRRAPRRNNTRCRRSNSSDGIKDMYDEEPLFGGNKSVQSDDYDFMNERREFGNSINSILSNGDFNDAASACSAPADLFDMGGSYEEPRRRPSRGGYSRSGSGGSKGNFDNNSMDAQKVMMIKGLLGESFGNMGANRRASNNGSSRRASRDGSRDGSRGNGNFNPQRIHRRRSHDDRAELGLNSSLNSNGSNDSDYCADLDDQPQRRKTLDDPFTLLMAAMGGNTNFPVEQMQNELDVDHFQNSATPLKRRKSEPMINSDFWMDDDHGMYEPPRNGRNAWVGQQSSGNVGMPFDNSMGPSQGNANHGNAQSNNMMSARFLAAAQEAFQSINRLKELMNTSQSGGSPSAVPMDVERGQQYDQQQSQWQQQQFQQLMELDQGQVQRHVQQWQQQGHQQQLRALQNQQQGQVQLHDFPAQSKGIPNEFMQQGKASNSKFKMNDQEAPPPLAANQGKKESSKSKSSSKSAASTKASSGITPQIPLPEKADPEILKMDQVVVMEKLKSAMDRTSNTQKLLQEWDRANGLPKSHSQTMVNSSRSRKQLKDGVILKKWNGAPLLNFAKEGDKAAAST